MAYDNNIPQSNDLISQSQSQILQNFVQLDTQYGSSGDHVEFTALTNNGTHKKVTVTSVQADPAQTFPASMVYTKHAGITPNRTTDLYFSYKPETGADVVLPLTFTSLNPANGVAQFTNKMQLKTGTGTFNIPLAFTTAYPIALLSVIVTPITAEGTFRIAAVAAGGFTATSASLAGTAFYFVSFGY